MPGHPIQPRLETRTSPAGPLSRASYLMQFRADTAHDKYVYPRNFWMVPGSDEKLLVSSDDRDDCGDIDQPQVHRGYLIPTVARSTSEILRSRSGATSGSRPRDM